MFFTLPYLPGSGRQVFKLHSWIFFKEQLDLLAMQKWVQRVLRRDCLQDLSTRSSLYVKQNMYLGLRSAYCFYERRNLHGLQLKLLGMHGGFIELYLLQKLALLALEQHLWRMLTFRLLHSEYFLA